MTCIIVIITIVSIVCAVLLLLYFVEICLWHDCVCDTSPAITFDAFRNLYVINPDKWCFYSTSVEYFGDSGILSIEFEKYSDVLKYKRFRDKVEKDKQELEKIKNEKKFLECVQHDIDTYRRENIEEIKKRSEK